MNDKGRMLIEPNEPCSILLEDCWLSAVVSRNVSSPIYSIGDYQPLDYVPSMRVNRARLILNDGYNETEYELVIGSIKKNPKLETTIKRPAKKYTGRRIQVD